MNERKSVAALEEEAIHHAPSIVAETTNKDHRALAPDLVSLSVDELWSLRGELDVILTAKIAVEVRELERRIDRLTPVIGTRKRAKRSSRSAKPLRRPYPTVLPKYRSPAAPFETWSGRGKQPRWVRAQLELGKRLEDFEIAAAAEM